jgi:hypothetical protein
MSKSLRVGTIAETLAQRFEDDGQCLEDKDGILMEQAAKALATDVDEQGDNLRYTFADGSVITVVSAVAWDFGYPSCFHWRATGNPKVCVECLEAHVSA